MPLEPCSICGSEMTLHFYSRGVESPPGNMRVCTNQECRASLTGINLTTLQQIEEWDNGEHAEAKEAQSGE